MPDLLPDGELEATIRLLFRDPEPAMLMLGAGPNSLPKSWLKEDLDITVPVLTRLELFDAELRSHLRLLAQQVPEFADAEDHARLEAEGIATLIALRDLYAHIPELRARHRRRATT